MISAMRNYNKKSLKEILDDMNLNLSVNPRGTDKGDYKSYVDKFYEKECKKLTRKDHIRILEIGVRHGASITLWSEYFKNVEITGIDNFVDSSINRDLPVNERWLSHDNFTLVSEDAYISETARRLVGNFDIIIDDGPHTLTSQLDAVDLYLDKLSEKGVMVIEDIQKYGGLVLLFFIGKVPVNFNLDVHDFRLHKSGSDNMLVTVRRSNLLMSLINRAYLLFKIIIYLGFEPIYRIVYKLRRNPSLSRFCV